MKDLDILTEENAIKIGEMLHKQHNAITSGRYDFTPCQLDILFMVLSGLKINELTYRIHVKDISLLTGRSWHYQTLKNSTETIGSRMFEIETAISFKQVWLFQSVEYFKGKGMFEVTIGEKAKDLFFEVKNNFTHFQLKSVLGCPSSHAKRIYMMACQWRTVGKFPKPILITEFKKMLGLVDENGVEQYLQISAFKERVLDVAKKQINGNTDLVIDYKLYKRGRSFTHIQLFIDSAPDKAKQMEIDYSKSIELQKEIANIVAYGVSEEQAELIAKAGYTQFEKLVEQMLLKLKDKSLLEENVVRYIVGTYQKKGILKIKKDKINNQITKSLADPRYNDLTKKLKNQ